MGTTILSTAICQEGVKSSLALACKAAEACVKNAGLTINDIDMLINIGIYHDDNIMEPAMAPLIQKQLGMNLDPILMKTGFTFCFDLYNGACGFINALMVADGFLKNGRARKVLIVSGDTHPSKTSHDEFPFKPMGAAVLLHHEANSEKGFSKFYIQTSTNGYKGTIGGAELSNLGKKGRTRIECFREDRFIESLSEFTSTTAADYMKKYDIDVKKIGWLISSQQDRGFAGYMHRAIGMNGVSGYVDVYENFGNVHTSSLPLCYHQINEEGSVKPDDKILFAAVGSGLTAAYAMYTA